MHVILKDYVKTKIITKISNGVMWNIQAIKKKKRESKSEWMVECKQSESSIFCIKVFGNGKKNPFDN